MKFHCTRLWLKAIGKQRQTIKFVHSKKVKKYDIKIDKIIQYKNNNININSKPQTDVQLWNSILLIDAHIKQEMNHLCIKYENLLKRRNSNNNKKRKEKINTYNMAHKTKCRFQYKYIIIIAITSCVKMFLLILIQNYLSEFSSFQTYMLNIFIYQKPRFCQLKYSLATHLTINIDEHNKNFFLQRIP